MNKDESSWLKKALNNLFVYLDNVFNINAGGCCFVSYVLAKRLECIEEEFKLVLYDEDNYLRDLSSSDIKRNIKNRETSNCPTGNFTCCHYALETKYLGIINPSDFLGEDYMSIKDISSKDILWIYEKGSWNSLYNSEVNDIIEENINLIFDAYERISK